MLDSLGKGATSISTERVLPIHSGQTPLVNGRDEFELLIVPEDPIHSLP
jgi:hypothetical protein